MVSIIYVKVALKSNLWFTMGTIKEVLHWGDELFCVSHPFFLNKKGRDATKWWPMVHCLGTMSKPVPSCFHCLQHYNCWRCPLSRGLRFTANRKRMVTQIPRPMTTIVNRGRLSSSLNAAHILPKQSEWKVKALFLNQDWLKLERLCFTGIVSQKGSVCLRTIDDLFIIAYSVVTMLTHKFGE